MAGRAQRDISYPTVTIFSAHGATTGQAVLEQMTRPVAKPLRDAEDCLKVIKDKKDKLHAALRSKKKKDPSFALKWTVDSNEFETTVENLLLKKI